MFAAITAAEYHLPQKQVTNQQIAAAYPEWTAQQILDKTGIEMRCHAAADECASDLAFQAAQKLFASGACAPAAIDFLLFCSQGADYRFPASACVLQDRLGLPTHIGALDYPLGCSGFVYGLGLAKGLIETRQANNVLLLNAETVSKFLHPRDRGGLCLFGDSGAATLIQATHRRPSNGPCWIGPIVYGTDGRGREHLIIRAGGMRQRISDPSAGVNADNSNCLYMNGPEVLTFALEVVPEAIADLLARAEMRMDDVDLFIFHQANGFMLEQLRLKLDIPADKFVLALRHCGNTSSASIPIALKEIRVRQQLRPGMRLVLMGFGAGYSWNAAVIESL